MPYNYTSLHIAISHGPLIDTFTVIIINSQLGMSIELLKFTLKTFY